jgi:hypothetical protein
MNVQTKNHGGMSPVLAIAILVCAIVGGLIGWSRASTPLRRRAPSEHQIVPADGVAQDDARRRLHRRFRLTLIYALLGVVVGLLALLFTERR